MTKMWGTNISHLVGKWGMEIGKRMEKLKKGKGESRFGSNNEKKGLAQKSESQGSINVVVGASVYVFLASCFFDNQTWIGVKLFSSLEE